MDDNVTDVELLWVRARRIIHDFFILQDNLILLPFNCEDITFSTDAFNSDVVPELHGSRLVRSKKTQTIVLKNGFNFGIVDHEDDTKEQRERTLQMLPGILEEFTKQKLQGEFIYLVLHSVEWTPLHSALIFQFRYSDPIAPILPKKPIAEREFCGGLF